MSNASSRIDKALAIASQIENYTELDREDRARISLSIDYALQAVAEFEAGNVADGFTCLRLANDFSDKLTKAGRSATVWGRVRRTSVADNTMDDTEAFERAAGRWQS